MNLKRILSTLLAAAVLMGLMALPAGANPVPLDPQNSFGVFLGEATVGKFRDDCNHDGVSTVSGPGLGHPLNNGKQAFYHFKSTVFANGKGPGTGSIEVCGDLYPELSRLTFPHKSSTPDNPRFKQGLGAACGASKGHNGKGLLKLPGKPVDEVRLRNIQWKASTSFFLVTGEALVDDDGKNKPATNGFVAFVEAAPNLTGGGTGNCANKTGQDRRDKTGGIQRFFVVGAFSVTPVHQNLNELPLTCKDDDDSTCLYKSKKTPKKT